MPTASAFDYAIVRVVPQVERGEFINVGIILFCRTRRFLGSRIEVDEQRLHAFAPHVDLVSLQPHLALIPRICAGGSSAGPIGQLSIDERFHWLVSPRSTVVQPSPVHCGICKDPQATLEHLLEVMVRSPSRAQLHPR